MKRVLLSLLVAMLLAGTPVLAGDFDCEFPPFGTSLEKLNKNGEFVKYMEKGGVAYYNYTGPCRLPIHSMVSPSVVFAFVNDQLYAKIVSYNLPPIEQDRSFKDMLLATYGKDITGDIVYEIDDTMEGDGWDVYSLRFGAKDILVKYKVNPVSRRMKVAWYYEPLRDQIKVDVDNDM